MAIRDILQLGNPYLRERSVSITNVDAPEVQRAINDLGDTLGDFQGKTASGGRYQRCKSGFHIDLFICGSKNQSC